MSDAVLVIVLMVFSHLVADFVLQNDWIAINKGTGGREGWSALGLHGFHVGLCLSPIVLAFGLRGLAALVLVVVSHIIVDRWKVRATRQATAVAGVQALALVDRNGFAPVSGLGDAWSPWPGILFIADQVLHVTFLLVAWLVFISGATLLPEFQRFVETVVGDWDLATVHATILVGVLLISLAIVNTRGAFYFVMSLVTPRAIEPPGTGAGAMTEDAPASGRSAAAVPDGAAAAIATAASPRPSIAVPIGAPARVAATIGGLERMLIVVLVLAGAWIAVALLLVVKTMARFRQLRDPGFVEYYLLGTLASVSVAVLSAAAALAALHTIGF